MSRRTATSSSRKRTDDGASVISGRLYIAVFVALVATLFLVPAAQATAETTIKVKVAGTGGGQVHSNYAFTTVEPEEINCPGACEGTAEESVVHLIAFANEGSEFAGWTVNQGTAAFGCDGSNEEYAFGIELGEIFYGKPGDGYCVVEANAGKVEVTATFEAEPITEVPLSVVVLGEGTVVSNPAGIACPTGKVCADSFEPNSSVTLTASPAAGWAFSSWSGCLEHIGLTCKVLMDKAKAVMVTFVATPSLTIEKSGSGSGKVAATGISCDESCSKSTSAIKTGTSVTVKTTPAKGSEAAVIEGGTGSASACSGSTCTFTISTNSSLKVKFSPIPTKTLTVKLKGPGAYKGKVTSKGTTVKGLVANAILCGAGCTTETESFFATGETELVASPAAGYTFAGWTVSGGSGGSCTAITNPCKLPTDADKTVEAEFE